MRGLFIGAAIAAIVGLSACSSVEAEKPSYVVKAHVDPSVELPEETQSAIGETMGKLTAEEIAQMEETLARHEGDGPVGLKPTLREKFSAAGISEQELAHWLALKLELYHLRGAPPDCGQAEKKIEGFTCEVDDPYDLVKPFRAAP